MSSIEELNKKTKYREALRDKLQRCYCLIKDTLKPSDIEYILDNFIESQVFQMSLIRDIRDEKSLNMKSTMLLDNLLLSDASVILFFAELIKTIVPDVYEYVTEKEGGLVIRRPLNRLRETIKRIETFHVDRVNMTEERYEELKNRLEVVEKEIGIWNNFLNTLSTTSIQIATETETSEKRCENCVKLMDENIILQSELDDIIRFMDADCSTEMTEQSLINNDEHVYYNTRPVKIGRRRFKLVRCDSLETNKVTDEESAF